MVHAQSPPYLFIVEKAGQPVTYEGYCVELADMICRDYLKIDYEIQLVKDGKYGERENGEWNGMVGELTSGVHVTFISLN